MKPKFTLILDKLMGFHANNHASLGQQLNGTENNTVAQNRINTKKEIKKERKNEWMKRSVDQYYIKNISTESGTELQQYWSHAQWLVKNKKSIWKDAV